jgi:dTDP-4-dehydrorhamnose reductase
MDAHARLLITGAGGLLGGALCRSAADQWDVYGLFHRHRPAMPAGHVVCADLTETGNATRVLDHVAPRAVIHAAAVADVAACQADPEHTEAINVQVPARMALWCARNTIPFGFVSTDLVFDGRKPPYAENRRVNPLNHYARQKAAAESAVLENYPGALVCRLPLLIGVSHRVGHNFSHQMLTAIRQGTPLRLFVDEFRTPVDVQSAAEGILALLGRAEGVVHLGGRTRVSRYELGVLMAAAMRRDPDMLRPVHTDAFPSADLRARDVSLDSRRAYGLGYCPAPLPAAIQRVIDQFEFIVNHDKMA